jgi:8-oxo-dGTP pyrophosphatase MutT (NUDIX family)
LSAPTAIRDAATVMLVRDGEVPADGGSVLEVFMLRRNLNSDFVGGAYVFPGGGVDDADRHADLEAVCEGRTDVACSELLGLDPPAGGLAYWVAAIRECFEEAGVLLAYGDDRTLVDFRDPAVEARFAAHRRAVDSGERRLVEVCADEGLRLAIDEMHYFSHWITPEGPPRRYDTRFFVTRAPRWQRPLHDDRETIANCWVRPVDALARHDEGEFDMILPTIRNLEALAAFPDAESLMGAAAAIESVPAIMPRFLEEGGRVRVFLPGEPGYEEAGDLPSDAPLPGRPGGPVADGAPT